MVEAEKEFSEHLTLPEIRRRLYDLVSQLATSRKYDAIRRAEDLQQLKEKLLVQYDERLHAELEKVRKRGRKRQAMYVVFVSDFLSVCLSCWITEV